MSATPKKKLCWNCEGRVALSEENCPFCGVYLSSSALINQADENSTHIAPYQNINDQTIPDSPYSNKNENEDSLSSEDSLEESHSTSKSSLLALTLLLAGSIFFIFGLILLVFARQGTLTLQWNASYWFVYLGMSVILLFMGWRSLKN